MNSYSDPDNPSSGAVSCCSRCALWSRARRCHAWFVLMCNNVCVQSSEVSRAGSPESRPSCRTVSAPLLAHARSFTQDRRGHDITGTACRCEQVNRKWPGTGGLNRFTINSSGSVPRGRSRGLLRRRRASMGLKRSDLRHEGRLGHVDDRK